MLPADCCAGLRQKLGFAQELRIYRNLSAVFAFIPYSVDFILTELRCVPGCAAAPVSLCSLALHFANTVVAECYRPAIGTNEGRRILMKGNMLLRGH